jgi:hypothetical protein
MPLTSLFPRRHARIRELLDAFVDRELSPSDMERVEAHLPSCAPCRDAVAATRAVKASLAALPEAPVPRSFRLTPAMAARPSPRPAKPAAPVFLVAARFAAAASVAAFTVAGTLSLTSGGDTGGGATMSASGVPESASLKVTDAAGGGNDGAGAASTAQDTVPAIASPPEGGGVSGAGVPSPEPVAGAATPSANRQAGPADDGAAGTGVGEEPPPAGSLALPYDGPADDRDDYGPWVAALGGLSALTVAMVALLEIRRRRT